MAITHPIYRDLFIDKGTDFSQIIELSVPYADYDFDGSIKTSYSSLTSVPIVFSAVDNYANKAEISVTAENTTLLRRFRGVYDIFATNKTTGEVHKEREGVAHYTESASVAPAPLPPPLGYQITLADITDAGTAAAANIEDFVPAYPPAYPTAIVVAVSGQKRILSFVSLHPAVETPIYMMTNGSESLTVTAAQLPIPGVQPFYWRLYGFIVSGGGLFEQVDHWTDVTPLEPDPTLSTWFDGVSVDSAYATTPENVEAAGAIMEADRASFATAEQGLLAETAIQPEEFRHEFDAINSKDYLGRAPVGSLDTAEVWTVTRLIIATNGSVTTDIANTLIAWTDRANNLNYI